MKQNIQNEKQNVLEDLGPLYHDYSFFSVQNEQIPGLYIKNQKSKFPILVAYISHAIAKSKYLIQDKVSFSELFCADGYFTLIASKLGCSQCYGIDNNKSEHFAYAEDIAQRLGFENVTFLKEDITPESKFNRTDIVANIGGLYHVPQPKGILEMSYAMAKKYLIVQTVVSLASCDEDYYQSPAPGWSWGNRYSVESFDKLIKNLGYNVIDKHYNELEGNSRLEDRGSVYYLIKK